MITVRVAAHVHSSWSYDGKWSLTEIAHGFARRGYDAVLMAEHDRGLDAAQWVAYREACAAASTPSTLLVPGIEYSDPTNTIHIPVWGLGHFLGDGLETGGLLRTVMDAGGVALLAHPARRNALDRIDPAWWSCFAGVELWNRKYDGYAPSRDVLHVLAEHPDLRPFVSLDFHTSRQFHPLAMSCDLPGKPSESAICAAILDDRLRPTAFGVPAMRLATGAALTAMCGLERARKQVAAPVRSARRVRQRRLSARA